MFFIANAASVSSYSQLSVRTSTVMCVTQLKNVSDDIGKRPTTSWDYNGIRRRVRGINPDIDALGVVRINAESQQCCN